MEAVPLKMLFYSVERKGGFTPQPPFSHDTSEFRLPASSTPRTRTCVLLFNLCSKPPHFPHSTFCCLLPPVPITGLSFIAPFMKDKHGNSREIQNGYHPKKDYIFCLMSTTVNFWWGFVSTKCFYEGKLFYHI